MHELQGKLKEKDRRLQYVIDHYEDLLTEKNRRLASYRRSKSESNSLTAFLLEVFSRTLDR